MQKFPPCTLQGSAGRAQDSDAPQVLFQVIPDVSLSFSLKSRQRCRANHASFLQIPWDGILGVDFGEGQGGALAIRPLRHGFAPLE